MNEYEDSGVIKITVETTCQALVDFNKQQRLGDNLIRMICKNMISQLQQIDLFPAFQDNLSLSKIIIKFNEYNPF